MIEVRFPTPEESKLEILNGEALEPIIRGKFVYVEIPKYKLAGLKKFITTNEIVKTEQIEEILSVDFPISPSEKVPLLVKFLEEIKADYTVSAYIKIQKRNFDVLIDFLIENGFEEM